MGDDGFDVERAQETTEARSDVSLNVLALVPISQSKLCYTPPHLTEGYAERVRKRRLLEGIWAPRAMGDVRDRHMYTQCNLATVGLAVSVGSRVRDRWQLVVACDPELASKGLRCAVRPALRCHGAQTQTPWDDAR